VTLSTIVVEQCGITISIRIPSCADEDRGYAYDLAGKQVLWQARTTQAELDDLMLRRAEALDTLR
jgi:hypothetical protein